MKSEFGRGLTYCLGLFLMHERQRQKFEDSKWAHLWFNGASDHLYELNIPDNFPDSLKKRIKIFQKKCLEWGHGFPKKQAEIKDVYWALNEAKTILRLIDKNVLNVNTEKGE